MPEHLNVQQICFTTWSAGYGTIALLASEVEQCSGRNGMVVERELFNQNNLILDGLQWAPLTKDKNYIQALELALKTVFPGELALLKSMGREFDFS